MMWIYLMQVAVDNSCSSWRIVNFDHRTFPWHNLDFVFTVVKLHKSLTNFRPSETCFQALPGFSFHSVRGPDKKLSWWKPRCKQTWNQPRVQSTFGTHLEKKPGQLIARNCFTVCLNRTVRMTLSRSWRRSSCSRSCWFARSTTATSWGSSRSALTPRSCTHLQNSPKRKRCHFTLLQKKESFINEIKDQLMHWIRVVLPGVRLLCRKRRWWP